MRTTPWTVAESSALSDDVKLAMLKEAKGGTWYDDWQPYCGVCSTMQRMTKHNYGFECQCCKNMIGWDLTRLVESPLNSKPAEPYRINPQLNAKILLGLGRLK